MMMVFPRCQRLARRRDWFVPGKAPETPLTWLETASVFPQRGRDDAAQRREVFPSVMKPRLSNQ